MFCFILLDYFKYQSAKSWRKVPLGSGLTNGEYIAHITFLLIIGLFPFLLRLWVFWAPSVGAESETSGFQLPTYGNIYLL